MNKKLYRSDKNRMISGVFGGLGEYFNVDPIILRLVFILMTAFTGFFPGIFAYILAVIIVPQKK